MAAQARQRGTALISGSYWGGTWPFSWQEGPSTPDQDVVENGPGSDREAAATGTAVPKV